MPPPLGCNSRSGEARRCNGSSTSGPLKIFLTKGFKTDTKQRMPCRKQLLNLRSRLFRASRVLGVTGILLSIFFTNATTRAALLWSADPDNGTNSFKKLDFDPPTAGDEAS